MPIAQRTATSGTAASSAGFSVTLPASTTTGDFLVVGITSATTTGPAAPTGWTRQYSASAGTAQCVSVYWAQYSAGLTLAFTNVAAISAWVCNSYWMASMPLAYDTHTAATNTGNNATLPTGAPTTGTVAGDFEVLIYGWTSSGTISGVAANSTIEITRANSTTCSVALGRNNNTNLNASTACVAFGQTLSASNTRKTGVGFLIKQVPPVVYKDLTGLAAGQATVGPASGAVFSDTFNRADGALGGNWSGTATITSNQAKQVGFGTVYDTNSTAPGTANYDVQADLSPGALASGGSIGIGIMARYSDTNNYYLLWLDQGGTSMILYEVVGGAYNAINSGSYTLTNPITIKLSCQGTAIKGYAGGVQIVSATNGTHTGAGITGLRAFNPDDTNLTAHRWDNFQILAGGGQTPIEAVPPTSYKDLTGSSAGRATIATAFVWGGGLLYAGPGAVWGATGVTIITGGPPPAGPKYITGTATGTSTATGLVTRQTGPKNVVGTAAGVATVSASLSRRRAIAASAAGVATVSALLSRRRALGASAAGIATTSGAVTARRSLTGTSAGRTTAAGFVDKAGSVFKNLFATANGTSTATGQVSRRRALVALSAGVATTSLALGRKRALTALSAGIATVSVSLSRRRALTALSAGRATVTALLTRRRILTGLTVGQATVSGLLTRAKPLTGLSVGQASVSGAIDKITIPLTSVIWAGDHFEQGVVGTLVLWDANQFQTDGEHAQVIWEDDVFKVYP